MWNVNSARKEGILPKSVALKTKAEGHRHQHKTHQLTTEDEETETETEIYSLYKMANNKVSEPIMVTVIANQAALTMEVDTGASASVISEATYQQLWPETSPVLHPSAIKLRTYTRKLDPWFYHCCCQAPGSNCKTTIAHH